MSEIPKIRGIEMPVERCIEFCRDYRQTIDQIKATGKRPEVAAHDIEFIELVGNYLAEFSLAAPMVDHGETPECEAISLKLLDQSYSGGATEDESMAWKKLATKLERRLRSKATATAAPEKDGEG